MSFSRRRGRPKKIITDAKDKGTIELQSKREYNVTTEPLDLCFSKGLINIEQHNAGVRLRWLHTLKLGAPSVSAYAIGELGGRVCKYEDSVWLANRQEDYNSILKELSKGGSRKIVVDVCIYGIMPKFLFSAPRNLKHLNLSMYNDLNLLINGLDSIASLHNKKRRRA
jgi:hypothetical protein